jgi:raffinose/stachyose/melibiose transport system permease protein
MVYKDNSPNTKSMTLNASSSTNRGYMLFLIPGVILSMLIIVFPLLANFGLSFTKWSGIGTPSWVGYSNYIKAIGDFTFWASFKNNLLLVIVITTIPTLIGLLLSGFLFEYIAIRFGRGITNIFRAGFYLPQIVPVVVAGIVWKWIFQPNWGVLNWLLNVVGLGMLAHNWLGDASTALSSVMMMMIWFQIGYSLVIFMAALQRVDPVIYEAAVLDGASWLQRYFYITIHIIWPEIFVVVLTTIIYSLKTFGQVYVMTGGGPGDATIVASYFSYQNFFERSRVGYGATIATVLTIIIILVSIGFIWMQTKQEKKS